MLFVLLDLCGLAYLLSIMCTYYIAHFQDLNGDPMMDEEDEGLRAAIQLLRHAYAEEMRVD